MRGILGQRRWLSPPQGASRPPSVFVSLGLYSLEPPGWSVPRQRAQQKRWSQLVLLQILPLPLTSCVALGRFLILSMPRGLQQGNGDDISSRAEHVRGLAEIHPCVGCLCTRTPVYVWMWTYTPMHIQICEYVCKRRYVHTQKCVYLYSCVHMYVYM